MKIKELKFKVIIKTNSNENKIINFDKEKKAYRIQINVKPIDGETNKELIKFLSRELKKSVRIISGFKNKEKLIEVF